MARNNLLECESKVFAFGAFEFDFPIVAALLAYLEDKLRFTGCLETEIEIVANDPAVDLYYPVTGFKVHLGAKAVGRHPEDLNPSAANVCDCWCYCKFVHNANR